MSQLTRIYLVRHGEAEGNLERRYLGTTDAPLTDTGRSQARAIFAAFKAIPIPAVYTSPLRRARATAERFTAPCSRVPVIIPELREQAFGAWENRTRAEVAADDSAALLAWERDSAMAPPGGESLDALSQRALPAFARIATAHPAQTVLIVAHVGPIKAIICAALGLPPAGARQLWLDPASVSLIEIDPESGQRVLRLFNAAGPR
jgi:probable phosphoglycerate mutase